MNCTGLMHLFWEADRDFSLVIFEIPKPVCEACVYSALLRPLFKALWLFSSSCLMKHHPYFWIRQWQASVIQCDFQRFTRDLCESEGCHCCPPCSIFGSRQLDFVVLFYFHFLRWTDLLYLPHHMIWNVFQGWKEVITEVLISHLTWCLAA